MSSVADELAALAAECFARPWSAAQFAAELAAPGGRVWWAGAPGAPAGYLLGHRVLDELEIRSLAVAPRARRGGTARALLDRVLGEAWGEGIAAVHLEVGARNGAARGLYAAAGFVEVGRRPGYYPGGEDALLMRRDLAGSQRPRPVRGSGPVQPEQTEAGSR